MDAVINGGKIRIGKMVKDWKLLGHFYADELVLYGEREEVEKMMEGYYVEVCNKYLKVNADKSKVMMFRRKEELVM